MGKPTLSIVIPAYREAKGLARTTRAVAQAVEPVLAEVRGLAEIARDLIAQAS